MSNVTKNIRIITNRIGLPLHANTTRDIADPISIIQTTGQQYYWFPLFFVIIGNLKNLNGFPRIHGAVAKIKLCQTSLL